MNTCLDCCLIAVWDAAAPRFLLINEQLPRFTNPYHFWQICEPVNQAVRQTYDLHVTTLRCAALAYPPEQDPVYLYLMQVHEGALPENARWIGADELLNLPLADVPFGENVLSDLRHWLKHDPEKRPLWYRPNWYADLKDKFQGNASNNIEHLRSWERSSIWRIPAKEGMLYLKVVPPHFGHEPALTHFLHSLYPAQIPAVCEFPYKNHLLMPDYGGQSLMEIQHLETWAAALQRYAQLQVSLIPYDTTLKNLGVPERSLQWLDHHIESLLLDESTFSQGQRVWQDEAIQTLRDSIPRLHAAVTALQQVNVPLTLEHGDLWAGQIIVRDGDYLITDWSDCTLTHPFFSLPFFLSELANDLPGVPVEVSEKQLREAYFSAWVDYETPERLAEAMTQVALLSPLFTAMRYKFDILPNMETQWEMVNMIGYNLSLLLKALHKS